MRLVRVGEPGQETPGILDDDGRIRDVSEHLSDITGEVLASGRLASLKGLDLSQLPILPKSKRLGAPISGVGKIIAVGLNYADHAAETKMAVPDEPILFSKAITSLCGPNDAVILPRGSVKTDWEVELAVVIGKKTQYVSKADALASIGGYTILNDVSERQYQIETSGQWVKGKSFDRFAPTGPWLVTPDEVPNPQKLGIWLELNGERMQQSSTHEMIFDVATCISVTSQYMTLLPGDIIATGTPPGVGVGRDPQVFLKPGDTMRMGIEGLGEMTQKVEAWPVG